MPDARHQRDRGVIENADHAVGELLRESGIELGRSPGVGWSSRSRTLLISAARSSRHRLFLPASAPERLARWYDARWPTEAVCIGQIVHCGTPTWAEMMQAGDAARLTGDSVVAMPDPDDLLADGARVLRASRLGRGLSQPRGGPGATLTAADDLHAMADAAWWLGLVKETMTISEECHQHFLAEGRPLRAAMTALGIGFDWFLRGELAIGSGWLSRARRLIEQHPDSAEAASWSGSTLPPRWRRASSTPPSWARSRSRKSAAGSPRHPGLSGPASRRAWSPFDVVGWPQASRSSTRRCCRCSPASWSRNGRATSTAS